jgi:cell division protein FtsL
MRAALLLVVLTALVASALALIDTRQESRRQFGELTRLERERDRLEVEYGKLKIQQAMLADTQRIELEAAARVRLQFPDAARVEMIER